MLTASDLLFWPFQPELGVAGRDNACRSLCYPIGRPGFKSVPALRSLASRTAAELAFRRVLGQEQVPYEIQWLRWPQELPRPCAVIGRRRCEVVNRTLTEVALLKNWCNHPSLLMNFDAWHDSPLPLISPLQDQDLLIFTFVLAQADPFPPEAPGFWLHRLPQEENLGQAQIVLQSRADREALLEVGGYGETLFQKQVNLPAGEQFCLEASTSKLTYLRLEHPYRGVLSLQSASMPAPYPIEETDWVSIYLKGQQIVLGGYISWWDFCQKSEPQIQESENYPPRTISVLPLERLHPLQDLFERARRWAKEN